MVCPSAFSTEFCSLSEKSDPEVSYTGFLMVHEYLYENHYKKKKKLLIKLWLSVLVLWLWSKACPCSELSILYLVLSLFLVVVPYFPDSFALFGYHGRTQLFFCFQSHPRGHVRQTDIPQANCKAFLCHPLSLVQGHNLVVPESILGR